MTEEAREESESHLLGQLLPIAYARAHYYERMWCQPVGEFETAAMMGAWDAVKRHDPKLGASLPTYARRRIDGEIIDWYRTDRQQTGGSRREHMRNVVRCVDFSDLGIDADGYASDAAAIEKMEQGRTYEKGFAQVDNYDLLAHLKTRMDEREWDIMIRCVCNEEYLKDVGVIWGVTESRICQILPLALRHARAIIEQMFEAGTPHQLGLDCEDSMEAKWLESLKEQGSRRRSLSPPTSEH